MTATYSGTDRRHMNHGVLLRRCACKHALGYHDERGCVLLARDDGGHLTRCTCNSRRSDMLQAPMRRRTPERG